MSKIIKIYFIALILWGIMTGFSSAFESNYLNGSVFLNFDAFVPTPGEKLPEDSLNGWKYYPSSTGSNSNLSGTSGWINSTPYPQTKQIFDLFKIFRCTYNSDHMGYETYGFLEIDNKVAVKGNSLKIITTGGVNQSGIHGEKLNGKSEYFKILDQGIDPFPKTKVKVGHPYLYFMNTSPSNKKLPFPQAEKKNRLSFYVKMPDSVRNDPKGKGSPQPSATMSIGPFNGNGGHWYHSVFNRGGGWTHVLVDGHPNHNNSFHSADRYPYPSRSVRDMDRDYFNSMYRFYITFRPYQGLAVPPYFIWIDEIEFYYDAEPQNNETINSPALTYHSRTGKFEIGFSDKYKNNKHSFSGYELKYSFAPITNENYEETNYAVIIGDSRFKGVEYSKKGYFKKVWPYYQAVWAPFRLKKEDQSQLVPGKRVYFAVKDLSARDYSLGTFDKEGDTQIVPGTNGKRRIDLIKLIDFIIPIL